MGKEIIIRLAIISSDIEVEVELPIEATPKDILETLFDSDLNIARTDVNGNPQIYRFVPKGSNKVIEENDTLDSANIQNGDLIELCPITPAGYEKL